MMVAKHLISSSQGGAIETLSRRLPRRRRKSKSRVAREHVNRLPGAWLMDVQESYSDTAR
jgi:hypothetical protein